VLATGAYRVEALPSGERRTFNSIYVIGDDGTILDAYDKRHLVPFGEYLPAADLLALTGLRQLAWSGFSPGPRRRELTLPSGATFAPLICYEAIFPGAVLPAGERPDVLLNVTNDGWFGRTIGPHQHFHQARVRSVEEGLPLVRAANTGISAVVDPYGRALARADLGARTAIEARLPAAIAPPPYARWRDLALALSLAACLLVTASRAVYPLYRH
jgi:apolipoprotein N-acyltransferase